MCQSHDPEAIYSSVEVEGVPEAFESFAEMSTDVEVDFEAAESASADGQSAPEASAAEASAAEAQRCEKIKLFKIRNWPEFKVEMKKQCKKILGRTVCVKVPQAFQRNCELTAYAEICHPDLGTIRGAVIECAKQAVVAGAAAGIVSGNPAVASKAFQDWMVACLTKKFGEKGKRVTAKVTAETKCGDWRPR